MRPGYSRCNRAVNVLTQNSPVYDGHKAPCVSIKPWNRTHHNGHHLLDTSCVAPSSKAASRRKQSKQQETWSNVPAPWAGAEKQAGQDLPNISSKNFLRQLGMDKHGATSALRHTSIILGIEAKLLRGLERPVLQKMLQDPATVAFKLLQLKHWCPLLDVPKLHTVHTLPTFVRSEVAAVEMIAAVKRLAHHGQMSFQQAQVDINYDGYVIRGVLTDSKGSQKKKEMYRQNLLLVQTKTRYFMLKRINTLKTAKVLTCFLQALMDEGRMDLATEGMAALDKLIAKEEQWDKLQ